MTDHDPLGDRLRRAVTTLPAAEPDWAGTARRVRRARAGRTAARIGIPAACALLAIGGAAVLSGRDGEEMSGSPAPAVASTASTTGTAATTATTVGTSVSSTAGPRVDTAAVPASAVAPSTEPPPTVAPPTGTPSWSDPTSWSVVGTPTSFGTRVWVLAEPRGDEMCVAVVRDPATVGPGDASCAAPGEFGVRLVDGSLHVAGSVIGASSSVRIRSSVGPVDAPIFAVGPVSVYAAVLPAGAELLGVDERDAPAGCPYTALLEGLNAADPNGTGASLAISVLRCAPGYAGVFMFGGPPARQGGVALLASSTTGWQVVNPGGAACEETGVAAVRFACDALGWLPASGGAGSEPAGARETTPTVPAA